MHTNAAALNIRFGWLLILSGLISGSLLGLFFHCDAFWGGYASFRRRIVRLGHISQVALGMLNVLFGLSMDVSCAPQAASYGLIVGGISMPVVCFLTGWKMGFRYLFLVPVTSLILAVLLTVI